MSETGSVSVFTCSWDGEPGSGKGSSYRQVV